MQDSALKCLLVDDEEPMLSMLAQYVETLGFIPIVAHDGDEGIAAFRASHPSLVVSDIHMPNRNGLLLLHDIKALNPEIPVILVTGVLLNYKAAMLRDPIQPDVLIQKPFPLGKLRSAIDSLRPAIERAWRSSDALHDGQS
jgi:DNA-binding response OmpR family regulator